MSDKHIFFIHKKSITPNGVNFSSVGNKAYNLIRMSYTGLPVPPAVILDTNFCDEFFKNGEQIEENFKELLLSNIRHIENATGLTFGGTRKPLLISIRSGGPVSMPGMLETLLNIGLCEKTIHGMIRMTGNPKMVWDLYRRLIANFAEIVFDCQKKSFDNITKDFLKKNMIDSEYLLNTNALKDMCYEYLGYFKELTGQFFPEDPYQQLEMSVIAVFKSWNSKKAKEYRKIHNIKDQPGTAVILQKMVFGNMGGTSGAGVAFTRNPSTGEKALFMDFIFNAQGEDIVAGRNIIRSTYKLEDVLPNIYEEIKSISDKLEIEFQDMQEFEFTIENKNLYLLQTRDGKRTNFAALKVAVDLVNENIISKDKALEKIKNIDFNSVKIIKISKYSENEIIGNAIPVSTGIVSGKIAFDEESLVKYKNMNETAILVREDIITNDISAINFADGILTAKGSRTSHAAVVARQLNKVCLVGCNTLRIDMEKRLCHISGHKIYEGELLCIDGGSGNIYSGTPEIIIESPIELINTIKSWQEK